jgi:hypothetical protein
MSEDKRTALLTQLGDIVTELGWSIIVPISPTEQKVDGVILGTTEFLEQMLYRFQDNNDEIVYLDKDNENKILTKIEKKDDTGDKGGSGTPPTFH